MNHLKLCREDMFTSTDHVIVRSAVKRLPGLLSTVVEMRFWQNRTICEIAFDLGVSVKAVESALKKAFLLLREECLKHPAFSQSLYSLIAELRLKNAA